MAKNSVSDYKKVKERLNQIKSNFDEKEVPPVYLLHGNLTSKEMADLYNHPKIKAFISLTAGEGFGLPLLEAAACGLPVVATNWSGHLDFLNRGKFSAVDYELKDIPDCVVWENILIKGSKWAYVKEESAKHRMNKIVKSYSKPKEWAEDLSKKIKEEFNLPTVCQNFLDTVKMAMVQGNSKQEEKNPKQHLESYIDTPEDYNALYTMPMSTGDVFISTAVIDGLKKTLPADAKIYFATKPEYFKVLKGNPNIHKVIPWNESMMSIELLEEVFDIAFTPNVTTQYVFSNWVRRGQGRLLAEEFANHCLCELGDYYIEKEVFEGLPEKYITLHAGSGKGQWEARKYVEWQEIVDNLKSLFVDLQIVQVGSSDEPELTGVIDLRGKTNIHQLAAAIDGSRTHLSIDTFTMHVAAALGVPFVSLFGSSHARSTGPWMGDKENARFILMESENRLGCDKACYKYQCKKNKDLPCINEIDPASVVEACVGVLESRFKGDFQRNPDFKYQRIYEKISGYTTTYNIIDYPFKESIKSMLGFCDEVVVVDGCSDDGTWEELEKLAETDDRIQLYQNEWDLDEPGMDGMQKAFARALCEHDYLWQMDADEVVHEDDYEKIKAITKRFPSEADILHLPVVELWGSPDTVTGRRHSWKWRMSRNKPQITHGINIHARLTDDETGRIYAKEGFSDGCEYINVMNSDHINHVGFYNQNIEQARVNDPKAYADVMNKVFESVPSVYHYSWCSLRGKVNQFKTKWDRQWSVLYRTENKERFPGVETEEEIEQLVKELYDKGGERSDEIKYKFKLNKSNPKIMQEWLKKNA